MALSAVGDDPMELVLACRKLIEHRPQAGPLVWLSARMITGADARTEARDAVEEIERDTTMRELVHVLEPGCRVLVMGRTDIVSAALLQRADIEAFVADTTGDGYGLVHQLEVGDHLAVDVEPAGIASAASVVDLILLETDALGPDAALCPIGSMSAAAVGRYLETPVWLVAGVGRCLPLRMWEPLTDRTIDDDPWHALFEELPLDLVDRVVGPSGPISVAEARLRVDCPVAPELFR